MKKILLLAFVFVTATLHAKNYYISASGSNTNNGLTPTTAWPNIAKLNASFGSIAAGDSILFKRGETFYGSIVVSKSGTTTLPIVFGAYGNGAKPVISGLTSLANWTNNGNGTWSTTVATAGTSLIILTINNNLQRMGRYPNPDASNGGYLIYTAANAATPSITGVTSSTNWAGAEVVIRKNHWILDRCKVTAQSGSTISYTNPATSTYAGKLGYGYFFQNDIRTLDQFGEWFLDKTTKNLSVYFGTANPADYKIKCSTIDTVLNIGYQSNITVQNLSFEGANMQAVFAYYCSNIIVRNCSVNNSYNGITLKSMIATSINQGNTITNCLNNGVEQSGTGTGSVLIQSDTIKNIALFPGMGASGDGTYLGINQNAGNSTIIELNRLDSIGYVALGFAGNNAVVRSNYITHFCSVKDDGAGIYTGNGFTNTVQSNREVYSNIVTNGIGATNGTANFTTPGTTFDAHGIYVDAQSNHVYVHNNMVSEMPNGCGVFLNSANDIQVRNNTWYNTRFGFKMERLTGTNLNRNIVYSSNIVYPTFSNILYFNGDLNAPTAITIKNDMRNVFITMDSNYYRDNVKRQFDWSSSPGDLTAPAPVSLANWQPYMNMESHSHAIDTNTIRFEYNPTNAPVTINLDAKYVGVDKTIYGNVVTLAPFSSLILLRTGVTNQAPVANAGVDKSITLPTNTVTLTGIGSDTDGFIASYAWVKISGPATGTIATPGAANTALNSLIQGVYQYELTVTDNGGATKKTPCR